MIIIIVTAVETSNLTTLREFYEIKKNFNRKYLLCTWTVVCVILAHIDAVWQFRQIQKPEDGHVGPKHVVLSGKK
jgi:hypothetical protein